MAVSFLLIMLFWTLTIAALAGWNYYQNYQAALHEARSTARFSFGKDLTFRRWATRHGGVYVPVTAETPPNPYLVHVPERDRHPLGEGAHPDQPGLHHPADPRHDR